MIKFPKPTVEQFFRTYVITNFTVSDDEEKLIFGTNLNGKMNLWAMDLPNEFPYLFAQVDESCSFIKIDPENRYVLAGFDKDEDEKYHIYVLLYEGGIPVPFISGDAEEEYFIYHFSYEDIIIYLFTM